LQLTERGRVSTVDLVANQREGSTFGFLVIRRNGRSCTYEPLVAYRRERKVSTGEVLVAQLKERLNTVDFLVGEPEYFNSFVPIFVRL
jgi:hypothetical protein